MSKSPRNSRIYLSPPHMSPHARELLLDAFDSNWVAPLGPHVTAFEEEFAREVDREYAVALSSGTAALHLALRALDVGPGDDVLMSALTFVATVNAAVYLGATPVFIDSEPMTWNIDPHLLDEELCVRKRKGKTPRAVVAVDIYGQCANYSAICEICQRFEVPLVEDAAEALGATHHNKPAGAFGAMAIFSFNGNKIITTSGGGMLVTDNRQWAEKARYWATQAREPVPHYEHKEIGHNYRLSNLLAAIGRGQLSVLPARVARRRAIFEIYRRELSDLPGVRFMPEPPGYYSTRWLTCVVMDQTKTGVDRETIRRMLEDNNIESRPVWRPMHLQPVYADCAVRGGTISESLFQDGLCLPSGSSMSDDQVRRVAGLIRRAIIGSS